MSVNFKERSENRVNAFVSEVQFSFEAQATSA